MRHSNKERDNVAESRPGSNTDVIVSKTCHFQTNLSMYCCAWFVVLWYPIDHSQCIKDSKHLLFLIEECCMIDDFIEMCSLPGKNRGQLPLPMLAI